MPTARQYFGAAMVNGILYAVGGSNPSILSIVEAYDPSTNSWSTKAPLPGIRHGLALVEAGGSLYAIGGNNLNPTNIVEAYDPLTNSWSGKAPMPTIRSHISGSAVNVGGIIYVIGGSTNGSTPMGTVEAYDPSTDSWSVKTPMPVPRFDLTVSAIDGIIYAVGGNGGASALDLVQAKEVTGFRGVGWETLRHRGSQRRRAGPFGGGL
jgi:N-acetylneuraminic acid mutarotase